MSEHNTGQTVVNFLTQTRTGKELDELGARAVSAIGQRITTFLEKRIERRRQNVEACLDSAGEKLVQRGGATNKPSGAEVEDLLLAASEADQEEIREMFSNLLAAKMDARVAGVAHPSFAKVLAQMGPLDARVLQVLYKSILVNPPSKRHLASASFENVARGLSVSIEAVTISCENLIRLGVLNRGGGLGALNTANQVGFEPYGWILVSVCTGAVSVEQYHYLGQSDSS